MGTQFEESPLIDFWVKAVVPAEGQGFTQFDCCWGKFRKMDIDSDSAVREGEVEAP